MKAIRIHDYDGSEQFVYEEAPQPQPVAGQVLVRVYATGVTRTEPTWAATWKTREGADRALPIPGHDVAGVIAQVGPGISGMEVGQPVYGLTDFNRDGAEAEYTLVLPEEIAPKPRSLDYTQAAAVPLAALTAWQAFFEHAKLSAGQRVLIHGASGSVGSYAVQLARWSGAHVTGTASARKVKLVRKLGAEKVIDYTSTRFEDVVHDVDVVLDTVGGETLERSWNVLKPGGSLVSVVDIPSQKQAAARDVRATFFIVLPNHTQLAKIGELIDTGKVRPIVEQVLPLAEAQQAYAGHSGGKIVLQVVDE